MASSFSSQISLVLHILSKLEPRAVLDIGKGFGKYGFLLHEYYGIDNGRRPNPELSLLQQSRVAIDAVECNPDYLWPHLGQFYRQIYAGRIEKIYQTLPRYDTVLMADVIEHIEKPDALAIVRHFVQSGSSILIATPRTFFQQDLYESPDERHVSHWTDDDFHSLGYCDYQNCEAGRVFLVSPKPVDIRGFGHAPIKRLRRIARAIRNEL